MPSSDTGVEGAVEAVLRERENRHISPPERGSEEWSCWVAEAEEDVDAAARVIRQQERQRVLDALRDWLGEDDEYEALHAILADLKENPQLVPEHDVPLRLLKALRAAVDRFDSLEDPDA